MSQLAGARPLAIVSGASKGIGLATSRALLARGLDVVMIARGEAALREAASKLGDGANGAQAHVRPLDVADEHAVAALARALEAEGRAPAVLVNNAGVVRRGPLVEDTAVADWDLVMGVNVRGPFLLCRAFLGPMKRAGRGRIVFVASISSTLGCPRNASYGASKWAVVGLMKSVAEETRGTGLVVTAVLPGSVDTEMLAGSGFAPAMSPEDVATTIVDLALDAPAAMHGSAVEMFG